MTWWREHELLDSSYERTYSHVVQNILEVGPLSEGDLGSVFTCISNNNNISAPVSRKVTVDLVFPPRDVSITTLGQPLSAGTTYVLSCETAGSRPDPVITWWLASDLMKEDAMQVVEKVKEVTKSTIYYTPTTADHGKLLACRAENPQMINSGIEDTWSLTVYCEFCCLKIFLLQHFISLRSAQSQAELRSELGRIENQRGPGCSVPVRC